MKTDSPFFLSVNYSHTLIGQKQNEWHKAMPMGINYLYKLTKTFIKSCSDINDNRKLTNHSARRGSLGIKVTRQGCTKRSNYSN
jgi:hypothetical protein